MKNLIKPSSILAIAVAAMLAAAQAAAAIYVRIEGVMGDVQGPGPAENGKWFIADSFSFGVEREMKESGEKGGTTDINIGVGELQEIEVTKSFGLATAKLAQFAANGRTLGSCDVCFTEGNDASGKPICYLRYKLDRVFVKSWSINGQGDDRPTEEVSFYYNKIAFAYAATDDDGNVSEQTMDWDNERNRPWPDGLNGIFDIIGDPVRDP